MFADALSKEYYFLTHVKLREAPIEFMTQAIGHCPNSVCTPPPRTQTGTLGHFQADLSNFVKSPFWWYISATKNPGKP